MNKLKVLNLYAGIGGNRKMWPDSEIEVTAVERDKDIASIYKDQFPNDTVLTTNAHKFLLEHYKEFDFIWSSPPCPTHTTFRSLLNNVDKYEPKYPNMMLYEEIIFLKHFFKGKWVIENVVSYYEPLIKPQKSNNHYFWSNFLIPIYKKEIRNIRRRNLNGKNILEEQERLSPFDLSKYKLTNGFKKKILNNCVNSKVGLGIFQAAFKHKQQTLEVINE